MKGTANMEKITVTLLDKGDTELRFSEGQHILVDGRYAIVLNKIETCFRYLVPSKGLTNFAALADVEYDD
jgi:hypothetical protein